jgi:predicted Zn-dependent protease
MSSTSSNSIESRIAEIGVLRRGGEIARALKEAGRLRRDHPDEIQPCDLTAMIHYERSHIGGALEEYTAFLERCPDSVPALNNMAFVLLHAN